MNLLIVFVKFLDWIVASFVTLVSLIEKKERLRFLKVPNYIKEIYYNYICIKKKKWSQGGMGPHLGPSLLVIDGSYDGNHKLSIDINGLIYDWNHDWWWKPRTVRSVMVMMSRGGTSKFGNVATLLFSVCGVPKHTISIRVFFFVFLIGYFY